MEPPFHPPATRAPVSSALTTSSPATRSARSSRNGTSPWAGLTGEAGQPPGPHQGAQQVGQDLGGALHRQGLTDQEVDDVGPHRGPHQAEAAASAGHTAAVSHPRAQRRRTTCCRSPPAGPRAGRTPTGPTALSPPRRPDQPRGHGTPKGRDRHVAGVGHLAQVGALVAGLLARPRPPRLPLRLAPSRPRRPFLSGVSRGRQQAVPRVRPTSRPAR